MRSSSGTCIQSGFHLPRPPACALRDLQRGNIFASTVFKWSLISSSFLHHSCYFSKKQLEGCGGWMFRPPDRQSASLISPRTTDVLISQTLLQRTHSLTFSTLLSLVWCFTLACPPYSLAPGPGSFIHSALHTQWVRLELPQQLSSLPTWEPFFGQSNVMSG